MQPHQAALWIDDQEAHVFRVEPETFTASMIRAPGQVLRRPRQQKPPHDRPANQDRFFAAVAQSLAGSDGVLVLGPLDTKLHFRDYVTAHSAMLGFHVAGLESVDHPTNRQVADLVRRYFDSTAASSTAPVH